MSQTRETLHKVLQQYMPGALPQVLGVMAAHIRARQGAGVVAVLAYGSTLRGVSPSESLMDFYVLTDDFGAVSDNALSRLGCRLVPPNVYYAEATIAGETYHAKYAVLPLGQFERKVSAATGNPYFWARFAQPAAVVFTAEEAIRQRVMAALATACETALARFAPLAAPGDGPVDVWAKGFALTYGSELRSEGPERARSVVEANAEYYRAVSDALMPGLCVRPINWRMVQLAGKGLSVLRLVKAAFTFQGGADYLAWKISRHSGQPVELTDWQRRHPILAAITLLPRLLKSGAVK
jgi:hypothetical protein